MYCGVLGGNCPASDAVAGEKEEEDEKPYKHTYRLLEFVIFPLVQRHQFGCLSVPSWQDTEGLILSIALLSRRTASPSSALFLYHLASTTEVMSEKPSFSDNMINSFLREK